MKSIRGPQATHPRRHLQKVDIVFSIPAPTSSPSTPPIQTSPLPFQQSQQLCTSSDTIYGYTSIRALRDDLRVYFEIIHGVPPPRESVVTNTEGTAIPPPVFDASTEATVAADATTVSADGSTVAVAGSTVSGATAPADGSSTVAAVSGATSIAGVISTTGATAADALFSTAAAAATAAGGTAAVTTTPAVRKRVRNHGHRRLQETTISSTDPNENVTLYETNATDVGMNSTDATLDENVTVAVTADNSTGFDETVADGNETIIADGNETIIADGNETIIADGNETIIADGNETMTPDDYETIIADMDVNTTTTDDATSTLTLSTAAVGEDSNGTSVEAEPTVQAQTTTPGPELSIDFEIESSIPVQFIVCPGTYSFDTLIDKDPIVIEALTHNPLWIRCATDDGECVFSGGQHHLSFNNHGATSADNSTEEQMIHILTVSGISFQKAAFSAVSMHDPRGEILFDKCEFSENEGAAMVIDGKYSGTYTAYYDYEMDDDTVDVGSSGGGNPMGSDANEDDLLQNFYEDLTTPAPITARPSGAEAPTTQYPTTALRMPPIPTISPAPSVAANLLNPIPEKGGYTGPPTEEPALNDDDSSSADAPFLLTTTTGTGTTATVDPSTTWSGDLHSTTTTHSTSFGAAGGNETDDFLVTVAATTTPAARKRLRTSNHRVLEVGNTPRSIVKIQSCSFHDNSGTATILMTSHYGEMEITDAGVLGQMDDVFSAATGVRAGDVPMAHSIHLVLENTSFDSDNQKKSVVVNDGGRLQTSEVTFSNNVADSIVQTQAGTIAMEQTEFTDNTITGKALVEMDAESAVESNENNCDSSGGSTAAFSEDAADTPVSSRLLQELTNTSNFNATSEEAEPALTAADGEAVVDVNLTNEEEVATSFNATSEEAVATADFNATSEEAMPGLTAANGEAAPAFTAPGPAPSRGCAGIYSNGICRQFSGSCDIPKNATAEIVEGCVSTWDELVTVVSERLNDERDFIVCPQSTLDIDSSTSQAPVVIDSDYITIKCGKHGVLSDECSIVGGLTQFHIVGSSPGIELSGLRMVSSRASSIVASASKDSTLILKNCEWASHIGESAVLIHSETATGASDDTLDISQLMSTTSEGAMAVEIRSCIFRKNTLMFGTIANIGGSLTVFETLFDGNTGKGGDIVLTNKGSGKVQGSCFDTSSSTAPGTIFVEFESSMSVNNDNFGINNTSVGGQCNAIFEETAGTSCLSSPAMCDGTCREFTSKMCSLPMYDKFIDGPVSSTPATGPVLGQSAPPHAMSEPESSNNLVPIIVATVVSAFVVFGLAGIVWKRKKNGKGGGDRVVGNAEDRGRRFSNPFASLRQSNQSQEEELNDAYGGFDDDEDMH